MTKVTPKDEGQNENVKVRLKIWINHRFDSAKTFRCSYGDGRRLAQAERDLSPHLRSRY